MPASIHTPAAGPHQHEVLTRALAWHSTPPIRVDQSGSPAYGAFLHGLDKREGKPLGVYTEITGYAVSLYTFLLRTKGESRFLRAGQEAADYLLRIQTEEGAFPQIADPSDAIPQRIYSFDTAMCIVGLARLAGAARTDRYMERALAAGDWLVGMQRPNGSFSAMQIGNAGVRDPGGFYGDGSCIHAKNAIALLELHAIGQRPDLLEAAVKVCAHTLTLQDADGAFLSTPESRSVFTHAHCYACEGLLYAGTVLGEDRFLAAARRGINWLARNQQDDGGWLSRYKMSAMSPRRIVDAIRRPEPSDAAAQAARLFRLMGQDYERHRHAAIRFLIRCQEIEGGFSYLKTRFGYSPLLYTWCAQFAVQALAWDSGPAAVEDLF